MKHYAIIGRPVNHSISGQWFRDKFSELAIDADFKMIVPSDAEIKDFRNWVLNNYFDGLLVTIPFKIEVLRFLDEMDPDVKLIRAANIIEVSDDRLIGYNTDHIAFGSQLQTIRPDGFRKALVMGVGGAAAAVIHALDKNSIPYTKVSRRKEAGDLLYSELSDQDLMDSDLIINTTPLGMGQYENSFPPIKYSLINKNALAFDLIYNPAETIFLKKCAEAGCQTANGLEMVIRNYEIALQLWRLV